MIGVRLVAVGLVAMTLVAGGRMGAQTIQVSKDNRTIAITTTDEAEAVADRAKVSVGFHIYGVDQDSTYAEASKTSNAIIKALRDSGVKEEAIESSSQNLSAIEDTDKARYSKGIRFEFSQSWNVTVPSASASDVLHVAITAGANSSGDISWEMADERPLEAEAAKKAMAHALEIAEQMAVGMKAKIGPLVYASNQLPARPGLFGYGTLNTESAIVSPRKVNLKPLAIRPEKITKSATVYAVFALE
jgi:uncharacterized protein YggE